MNIPDLVNAAFEFGSGLMMIQNCRRLWRDRLIAGIDWRTMGFFAMWGWWNLFYYPHLGQIASFLGGLLIVASNTTWVIMALKFRNTPSARP